MLPRFLLLLLATAPALAQPVLPESGTVEGTLTADGDTLTTGQFAAGYVLEVTGGVPFEVALTSSDFDTYLILVSPSGGRTNNDDWEGSASESRLLVDRPEVGEWVVAAAARRVGEQGAYRLSHRARDPGELERAAALERAEALNQRVVTLSNGRDRVDAALPLAREAVAIFESVLDPDHPDLAGPLGNLAGLLEALGEHAEARPLYERALAIHEATLGPDHPSVALALNNLAGLLEAQGDYAAARPLYERALAVFETAFGPDHPDIVGYLNSIAQLLKVQGDYAAARPLYERALAVSEAALAPDHPDVAPLLNNLALLLKAQGDYAAARPLYERALTVVEAALGPDHPDMARMLSNLAGLLSTLGEHAEARPLYERALAIHEAAFGPDHPDVAVALNNLGVLLHKQGASAEARPLYERALAVSETAFGPDHPQVAEALGNLGFLLYVEGDYAAARPLYERALAVLEAALGPDHPDVAQSLIKLGVLLDAQGDDAAARPLYERALAVTEAAFGPDHPDVALALNNLGFLLYTQGAYAEARPLYERALAIREAAFGTDHPDVAQSLNNLAVLLSTLGEHARARPISERALAVKEAAFGPDHPDVALALNNLGFLLYRQGDDAAAQPLYERALAVFETAFGPDHPDIASPLNNLALLLESRGDHAQAQSLVARAARIYAGHAERVLPTLSAAEQRAFVDVDLGTQTGLLLSTHPDGEALASAYTLFGGWKGLLLRELRRQTAVAALADDPAHADAVADLQALRTRVAAAYRDGDPALDALTAEKEALERRLAQALPPEAASDPWREAGRGGLAGVLPDGAAFADIYRYTPWERGEATPRRYAAVVVVPGAAPVLADLGPAATLDAALQTWRDAVTAGQSAQTAALAERLWAPILAALPDGTERVWVAPDGALARAPWSALADEHGAGVLAAQVPSGRALLGLLGRETVASDGPVGSVLVVGGVDFGDGGAFAPLPGTATEAVAVAALAGAERLAVESLEGGAPTVPAVVQSLSGATYAHLATHGFFYAEPAATREAQEAATRGGLLAGRLLRTDEEDAGAGAAVPPGDWGRSPLALSGLALAGANAPGSAPGGGTLTAEEIVGLDLSGVRLVALSACDTGRGAEVTGQGVLGLQASLAAAGAGALLMSLWPVDDAATAALMGAFYRGLWADDLAPAEALRRAQAEVRAREAWARPVFWAGWTLSGDAF